LQRYNNVRRELLTQPKGETMNSDGKSKLIVYAEHDGKLWAREYTEDIYSRVPSRYRTSMK